MIHVVVTGFATEWFNHPSTQLAVFVHRDKAVQHAQNFFDGSKDCEDGYFAVATVYHLEEGETVTVGADQSPTGIDLGDEHIVLNLTG